MISSSKPKTMLPVKRKFQGDVLSEDTLFCPELLFDRKRRRNESTAGFVSIPSSPVRPSSSSSSSSSQNRTLEHQVDLLAANVEAHQEKIPLLGGVLDTSEDEDSIPDETSNGSICSSIASASRKRNKNKSSALAGAGVVSTSLSLSPDTRQRHMLRVAPPAKKKSDEVGMVFGSSRFQLAMKSTTVFRLSSPDIDLRTRRKERKAFLKSLTTELPTRYGEQQETINPAVEHHSTTLCPLVSPSPSPPPEFPLDRVLISSSSPDVEIVNNSKSCSPPPSSTASFDAYFPQHKNTDQQHQLDSMIP
ncbi:unnamed protein product, partial [Amoebophrya sp. A120]|eukprot:GSA120T00008293001.1